MKLNRILPMLVLLVILLGCSSPGVEPANPQATISEEELPTPVVRITKAPDPQSALDIFLAAWQEDDYASMHAMLSAESQQNIGLEDFSKRYNDAMNAMALRELKTEVLNLTYNAQRAQANLRITYTSNVIGAIERETLFGFKYENGNWKIEWEEGMILPELRGGNILSMDYTPASRGNIYDRNGNVLVEQTDAVAIYLIPGELIPEQEGRLISEIAMLTGENRDVIRSKYANAGSTWRIPLGEASQADISRQGSTLRSISGVSLQEYTSRFYYNNGVASHVVGYTTAIPAEQLDQYLRAGYPLNALVGQTGIELWAEETLAGKHGGTLYVISPTGNVLSFLGRAEAVPGSDIYLTIDRNLQIQAQQALGTFPGAIVVMENDTGRVLAMVSNPGFDSNLFNPQNPNTLSGGASTIFDNPNRPLYNRATQGQYPLGSVFKIISMAAALESGVWTPDSEYNCGYEWTDLPGRILTDWTYEKCVNEMRETGETFCTYKPSGIQSLVGGLMRSCNPWFYHIGYDLYRQGRTTAIADMARGFGLGNPTGIDQINEQPGVILNPPVPSGEVQAVNQSIGQGDVQVTPLQVATFTAALGNGGTLYRPQVVEKIVAPDGIETTVFKPEARGTLPISEETLAAIREGMREVISNTRGTAHNRFYNFRTPIYGKTGTAQASGLPHSWFAGYTDMLDERPDIAIAVIAENRGEGSEYATPIFRRVAEIYIAGRPQARYWWESQVGLVSTPTPLGGIPTETPEP